MGYPSSTLMNPSLFLVREVEKRYREALISRSVIVFQTYAVNISGEAKDGNGKRCPD